MKVQITSVRDAGNLEKERVVMKVLEPTNIGLYTLLQTGYANGKVNIDVKRTYWFPYKPISSGDFVVLYTKKGKNSEKDINQAKSHFFYWELPEPIWSDADTAAVLLHSPEWQTHKEEETQE
jgi:hypothetical protein